jgi:hypothetical protein
VFVVARVLPPGSKIVAVGQIAALGALYVAGLVITRELGRNEVTMIKRVLKG